MLCPQFAAVSILLIVYAVEAKFFGLLIKFVIPNLAIADVIMHFSSLIVTQSALNNPLLGEKVTSVLLVAVTIVIARLNNNVDLSVSYCAGFLDCNYDETIDYTI